MPKPSYIKDPFEILVTLWNFSPEVEKEAIGPHSQNVAFTLLLRSQPLTSHFHQMSRQHTAHQIMPYF